MTEKMKEYIGLTVKAKITFHFGGFKDDEIKDCASLEKLLILTCPVSRIF